MSGAFTTNHIVALFTWQWRRTSSNGCSSWELNQTPTPNQLTFTEHTTTQKEKKSHTLTCHWTTFSFGYIIHTLAVTLFCMRFISSNFFQAHVSGLCVKFSPVHPEHYQRGLRFGLCEVYLLKLLKFGCFIHMDSVFGAPKILSLHHFINDTCLRNDTV